jgi:hypothetical protein
MKKYLNLSIAYAIVALVFGVFYREYTKLADFSGVTRLSFMHVHYLALGLFFFLFMAVLEKLFTFSAQRGVRLLVVLYNVGLTITGLGLLLRGLADVAGEAISRGLDASISGVSGLGHVLLGVGIVLLLFKLKKAL